MPESTRERNSPVHRPVLLREVIQYLDLKPGLTVVDGTVGAGGHSQHILKKIGSEGKLIGLDRDSMMLRHAEKVLSAENCRLIQSSYADLEQVLEEQEIGHVDRILLDLGLSSDQLADDERGFGFQSTGPLDLRFDTSRGKPAWKFIDKLDETELAEILKTYGEERFSRSIAKQLVACRTTHPIRTAGDLVEAVSQSVPKPFQQQSRKHPATRVFQALRIAVNDELKHLQTALDETLYRCLAPGGQGVVISFHSLEDRLVKQAFRDQNRWQNLTTKPVTASTAEKRMNPRSRTAKLRAATKK